MLLIYHALSETRRLTFKRRWSQRILDILAIRLDARLGDAPPGSLFVANHISWIDIFALNAARPVAFVAKAEVRAWPLIGWLSRNADTVFLMRGSRGHARVVNGQINALLAQGKDVAIFPEGTTTDGTHLLNFHGALLQPAVESGRPVQPVALSYRDPEGKLSTAAAYVGDTTLLQSLARILACPSLTVRLEAMPLLSPEMLSRREMAQSARAAIALSLGHLPASTPPETPPDPQGEPPSVAAPTSILYQAQ